MIDDQYFKISTNSHYIYQILKLELFIFEPKHPISKEIIIEYIPTDLLYSKHVKDFFLEKQPEPIVLICKDISKIIISSMSDIYSIRAFITREILSTLYKTGKYLALHASVTFINQEKGVLFSGEKNSGKSSLVMAFVLYNQAKLVVDDITILYKKGEKVFCEGIFKGINANETTSDTFRSGVQDDSKCSPIKDRYITSNNNCIKKTPVDIVVFPTVYNKIRKVIITKISQKSFTTNFNNNLIRSYFGKKLNVDKELQYDIIKILSASKSSYRIKLKKGIIDSYTVIKESFGLKGVL